MASIPNFAKPKKIKGLKALKAKVAKPHIPKPKMKRGPSPRGGMTELLQG